MSFPVFCHDCGACGEVPRITPGLMCRCGSREVDLFEGTPANLTAIAKAEECTRRRLQQQANSGGTGWNQPRPDPLRGWDEYPGPMPPSLNPMHNGYEGRPLPCKVCEGSGFDLQDGVTCRECGGSGFRTPPTSVKPAPEVARHNYPSTQTTVPFVGSRNGNNSGYSVTAATPTRIDTDMTPEEVLQHSDPQYTDKGQRQPKAPNRPYSHDDAETHYRKAPTRSPHIQNWQPAAPVDPNKPLELEGAHCPNCGQNPTHLMKDHKEHAWWTCPNCGPLADIDKHPEIDPYSAGANFQPIQPSKFRTSSLVPRAKDGKALQMMATITRENPGLSLPEVLYLARTTIQRYAPEGR